MNKVSNLAWSCAVMKPRRILGIFIAALGSLRPLGLAVPPVWKEAAISLNPVACGFWTGAGGGKDDVVEDWAGADEKGLGWGGCCCCCCWNCCWYC